MSRILKKINQKCQEIFLRKYFLKKISTIKDYCESDSNSEYIKIENSNISIVCPNYYYKEEKSPLIHAPLPEKYISKLINVNIIGGSNVIIANNRILYDMLVNKNNRINITDKGLFCLLNRPIHFNKYYFANYASKGNSIPEAINFCGNFSFNLYHFLYEFLSKFYIIEKCNLGNIPILFDSKLKNIKQFRELMSIFVNDHRIIYVNELNLLNVKILYHPSFVNNIPPNYKNMEFCKTEDVVFDKNSLFYVRNKIMNNVANQKYDTPKKIFISRKNSTRRSYNENEIIPIVTKFGYEVVYPEEMSYYKQVCLFRDATEIIAASGAALTNIICCSPNCKILVLMSVKLDLTIFSSISYFLSLDMIYITGRLTSNNNIQSNFEIDPKTIEDYLMNHDK